MKNITLGLLLLFISVTTFAQKNTNPRAAWFTDARFGMFIHWGIYSGAEGFWKGEKLRHHNNYAEWIKFRNSINNEEYITLLDRFDWNDIQPEEWVILAKKSGMKYVTITAKHHDGFALWDSKVSDYDLGNYSHPKRDIIREMADACKKHGIKFCLYYSHWVDWEHSYGWNHSREIYPLQPEEYDQYWQEKVVPQIKELLSNYGDISMLWFDMWLPHEKTIVTKDQLLQLKSIIRELQPNCVVNSRLGLSIEENPDIDYKTLGDNKLGNKKEDFPWQSPATVAHSWGFHSSDAEWQSTTALLKALISNVSLNGNYMLNIGPRANGDVPYEISHRMLEMGKWLDVNGEAIYGAEAFDLDKDQHDWGKITCKKEGDKFKLYLHLYNWPLNKKLNLTGVTTAPQKVYLLADKQKQPIDFNFSEVFTEINLPHDAPDNYISVVVAEYNSKPNISDGLIAKTVDNGYSLLPGNQNPKAASITIQPKGRKKTIPEHVIISEKMTFSWKIYVDEVGEKDIDVSYSFQNQKNVGKITVSIENQTLTHQVLPTGETVGEPNMNWHIDYFKSNRLGKMNFSKKGYYTVKMTVEPQKKKEIKFQWLWIK
ncbi:alpha-L-fucosidase [Flammeovirga pacifica]|uniref:alpha-L-fucosidase n=1 Tax=Flammeovirga pacifica TaxID=915059 RepID=A0A1S1YZC7_FLAPC|nr:alpha-L-fucosidase [Flammeovirga pacifica]OHX66352.1 hypothetical protein NH26_08305 [Flammeovirga pacifica]